METVAPKKKVNFFAVVISIIAIAVLIWFFFNFFPKKKPIPPELPKKEIPQELTVNSFGDLFSGSGYINTAETSMYQDIMVTAFTFPPKIEIVELDDKPETEFLDSKTSEKICIASNCLGKSGTVLYFNGKNLNPPDDLSGKKILKTSIGLISEKWPVVFTVKENNIFKTWLYLFDGSKFTKVIDGENGVLNSKYDGEFGFGGENDHWLAFLGAYEGRGVEVKSKYVGFDVKDISRFFNTKLMAGGFLPGILKNEKENWYLVSRTPENPKLVKLFENGAGGIVGAIDLTAAILPEEIKNNIFFSKAGESALFMSAGDGGQKFYKITDLGFENGQVRYITSSDTYNVPAHPAEIRLAKITNIDLEEGKSKVVFYLSSDGKEWFEAKIGELVEFPNPTGRVLLWKAKFSPSGDNQNSPFFDKINISLWRKTL